MKKDILYINSVDDIRIIDTLRVQKKHDYSKDYLTFEALEDGEFAYTICYGTDPEMADIPLSLQASAKLQYSFNRKDWFDWVRTNLTSESINILANQKLYIRGYTKPIEDAYGTVKFSSTCRFNVCGLLSSLLYGYDYEDKDFILTKQPMEDTHFAGLFDSCDKLISAENLILPQELVRECYNGMFTSCTSLTTAPELPATILAGGCYSNMFQGCTALTTAPVLPATTLANYCYQQMFSGCTALTTAPTLPATTLASGCYQYMFNGCTSLTTAPELPATTLTNYCYSYMFDGCTALITAPELPATTLAIGCYNGMFINCASLATAPELPATTLEQSCYRTMFSGCTSLCYIKAMFTTLNPNNTYEWVKNVASNGTFVKNSAAQWNVSGVDGIPTGWTVETATE